jgi:hypothetical protein
MKLQWDSLPLFIFKKILLGKPRVCKGEKIWLLFFEVLSFH